MGEGVDEAAANIDAVLNFNIKSKLDVGVLEREIVPNDRLGSKMHGEGISCAEYAWRGRQSWVTTRARRVVGVMRKRLSVRSPTIQRMAPEASQRIHVVALRRRLNLWSVK